MNPRTGEFDLDTACARTMTARRKLGLAVRAPLTRRRRFDNDRQQGALQLRRGIRRRCRTIQRRTKLALMPCAMATPATETPGSLHRLTKSSL